MRDALDAPLDALSETEKERAQWLSEDLYSVSEPPPAATLKEMNPEVQMQLYEAFESRQTRKWDRALELLRRLSDHLAPSVLSFMRGTIWEDAGYPDVAAFFYEHASECEPANAKYRALYLVALAESNPAAARKLVIEVLADDAKYPPLVVAEAANIRFQETSNASEAESLRAYRELIPILERTLTRIERQGDEARRLPAYEMIVGKLGICHQLLGNSAAAVDYFSRGLQANPKNDGLLVARGILSYGISPRAITDFEQALELGSSVVWPYVFLAHHYLLTSRFEQCRLMCETGLRMSGSESAKSRLEEWRAIAQAELGFPSELVRASFEAAIRLDPSDDLARRNHASFEASIKAPRTRPYWKWEQRSEATLRQFGLAERRYSSAA